jgi:hypothetical protein
LKNTIADNKRFTKLLIAKLPNWRYFFEILAKLGLTKVLLDLSMAVCFGKTHRCAKECSRTGAIPSIPTVTGSWRIKKPLKRCLVHSPAMKNGIEIYGKET